MNMKSALSMAVCATIGILAVTYVGVQDGNTQLIQMSSSYAFILVVFQAVGMFGLLKETEKKEEKGVNKLLAQVDRCSFGIYLMHVLFLYLFYRVGQVNPFVSGAGIKMLGISLLAFLGAWGSTWLLKHVPWIKDII